MSHRKMQFQKSPLLTENNMKRSHLQLLQNEFSFIERITASFKLL